MGRDGFVVVVLLLLTVVILGNDGTPSDADRVDFEFMVVVVRGGEETVIIVRS